MIIVNSNITGSTSHLFLFSDKVKEYGKLPALITPVNMLTYQEYYRQVLIISQKLRDSNLKFGDKLAILAPNSLEYIVLLIALWYVGIVAVPISTRWPKSVIEKNLENIHCNMLIFSETLSYQSFSKKIRTMILEELVSLKITEDKNEDTEELSCDLNQNASIVFTSGSSGFPRAVVHTLGNHYFSALGSNQNIPVSPGDRWLLSLPLYHVGGLSIIVRSLLGGGAIVIREENKLLHEVIENSEITHISLVSTQFQRLLQNKDAIKNLRNMKAILLGGGPVSDSIIQEAVDLGLPLFTSYGSTEMASQISSTPAGDTFDRLKTCGKLLQYRELKIAFDGEVLVKGVTLGKGYIDNGKLVNLRDREGWYHTGDFGKLDNAGYLIVIGRKDNMFISGGENIQPEEIENILSGLKGIETILVVPVKNEEFGHRPVAFVKMSVNKEINIKFMKQYLEKHLPRYKIPDHFFSWPADESEQNTLKIKREKFRVMAEKLIDRKKK